MADAQQAEREPIAAGELSDVELRVLSTLEEARQPLDAIEVASATLLSVEEALDALRVLHDKGIIHERPPEPIRERFRANEDALQRVAG